MIIGIQTDEDSVSYKIKDIDNASNDEICRAITHLELIKQELLGTLNFDFEVVENNEDI